MTFNHRKTRTAFVLATGFAAGLVGIVLTAGPDASAEPNSSPNNKVETAASSDLHRVNRPAVHHKTVTIDGLDVFYREAGPKDAPTVLLLHGFPTSSHMFRNLIPALADRYHVVVPDYPGYGNSSMPQVEEFDYTFDNLTDVVEKLTVNLGLEKYSIYLMDYGAPLYAANRIC